MKEIKYCEACKTFTFKMLCSCAKNTQPIIPLKYVPHDKYAAYRRTAKETQRKKEGLL